MHTKHMHTLVSATMNCYYDQDQINLIMHI